VVGVDTSVAVALLIRTHDAHQLTVEWWGGRELALCGHALVETYSVLTRLPGTLRLEAVDAARLLSSRFTTPLLLGPETASRIPEVLSERSIAGAAVYDALIGLTAVEHNVRLATRDGRARATYDAVGASVEIVS
jgi:predicted nucleic acid-binding protein